MMRPRMDDTYLTPRDAARYLSSSQSTLAKMRCAGAGPCFTRIGRAVRYRRSDLDKWMEAGRVGSTSDTPERSITPPNRRR